MNELLDTLKRYHGKAKSAKKQSEAMIHEGVFREFCWMAAETIINHLEELKTRREIEPWDDEAPHDR